MTYFDTQQWNPWVGQQLNPWQQQGMFGAFAHAQPYGQLPPGQLMQGIGLGQAAYGQAFGQPMYGQPQFGYGQQLPMGGFGQIPGWGSSQMPWGQPQPGWGQFQRQLSPQDVGEVVRQLLPALPQIVAQAQQPQTGYAASGQPQRQLSPHDVNEIVRQLLPVLPQIINLLQQGQPQLQHAAVHGGYGANQLGQSNFATGFANQQPFASQFGFGQNPLQQPPFAQFGQPAWPYAQAAYAPQGAQGNWTSPWGQPHRQLTQQDATEVARQLVGLIPQVIGNLQNVNQQRMI
jgi:hypothetical protein